MSNGIKVVCRFRPQNSKEIAEGGQDIVKYSGDDTVHWDVKGQSSTFTFDRVFNKETKQADIFDYSIKSTVDDLLEGYNGTVFAYGQTSAGKSHTMMGKIDDEDLKGMIPRIVEQIFARIMTGSSNIEYTVRVGFMEIYLEKIKDLLSGKDNLAIHQETERGVYVEGLAELYCSSVTEVVSIIQRGDANRTVSATNMNEASSRSHSILVITVAQKNIETSSTKTGRLYLVDLAGSEKVAKTGATGKLLDEAKKINQSLSALGNVINALTDGKHSHIPYRDSRLTRLLSESLGGNSRTTLIINCSPSNLNDAETLSTLRFGIRAKSIKNKARVNAELSPAELKAQLKKTKAQLMTYEEYITGLEGELILWRGGDSVPTNNQVEFISRGGVKPESKNRPQSRLLDRPETPSLPERAGTPSLPLEKDEKEEFLRQENKLQDEIAEKETLLSAAEKTLQEVKEELAYLKEHDSKVGKDNEKLTTEVNEAKMHLEKLTFESKEAQITMDALKEANAELTTELDELKQQLLEAKMNAKETSAALDEKEKRKQEKMAKMMAGFDLGGEVFSDNERQVAEAIQKIDAMYERISNGDPISPDDVTNIRAQLVEAQGIVRQAELTLYGQASNAAESRRRAEVEERYEALQQDYEELLTRNLAPDDVEEVKARLEVVMKGRQDTHTERVSEMKIEVAQKDAEIAKQKALIEDLQRRVKAGTSAPMANGKTIQQQLAEFDVMKKSLMRDLQNRCERVVELEISLDETREQYNNVLRSSNNRAQQKKMAFLERNLEQLTQVQRQLVEQNSSLKKEVAIAERKLIARNERIQSLESLLQDSQEKLTAANHRFEAQLATVKERLEAAKQGSTRGLNSGGFSFTGSRIAKPLRGGGDAAPAVNPAVAGLQNETTSKRSSWFFASKS